MTQGSISRVARRTGNTGAGELARARPNMRALFQNPEFTNAHQRKKLKERFGNDYFDKSDDARAVLSLLDTFRLQGNKQIEANDGDDVLGYHAWLGNKLKQLAADVESGNTTNPLIAHCIAKGKGKRGPKPDTVTNASIKGAISRACLAYEHASDADGRNLTKASETVSLLCRKLGGETNRTHATGPLKIEASTIRKWVAERIKTSGEAQHCKDYGQSSEGWQILRELAIGLESHFNAGGWDPEKVSRCIRDAEKP